jgi:uncharacterized protein YeaO (DUF488 family)
MKLFTIGFTGKSAEDFFSVLTKNKVNTIIDIRLNNNGMFANFTKKENFPYFLRQLAGIDYIEMKSCAPTKELLNNLTNEEITWGEYKKQYLKLLKEREVEKEFTKKILNRACLLCAEPEPDYCHRKLLAEYLSKHFDGIVMEHL